MFPRRLGRSFSSTPFPSFPLFQGTGQPLAHHPQTHARAARPRGEMNHLQWEIVIAGFLSWKRTCTSSGAWQGKSWPTQGLKTKISWGSGTSLVSYSYFFTKKKQTQNQPPNPNNLYTNIFNCKICTVGTGRWENPYKISSSRQDILCVESFKGLSDSWKLAGCSHCIKLDYMGKNSWSECHLAAAAAYKPTLCRQRSENPAGPLRT